MKTDQRFEKKDPVNKHGRQFCDLSVIVLTRNNERTIKQCLESIVTQIPYDELIIVDGNSTDRTLDIACTEKTEEKIDVVMITKNSFHPCLDESLLAIIRNVPLKRLIVVDSFSTDSTSKLLDEYKKKGVKVKIIQQRCNRGKAREIGIREVDTEWFAFMDSDGVLVENWFLDIARNIKPRVGAIEGMSMNRKLALLEGHTQTAG